MLVASLAFVGPMLGMQGSHHLSLLRWGSFYTEVGPGTLVPLGNPRSRRSTIWAFAGEDVVIDSEARIDRGKAFVTVSSGYFGGERIHDDHISAASDSIVRVPVEKTGFYRIRVSYYGRFRGRLDVDWRVD